MNYETNSQEDLKEAKNKPEEHAYFTHNYIYIYIDKCVGEGDAYQKRKRGQR
jgi:hypothetical protein